MKYPIHCLSIIYFSFVFTGSAQTFEAAVSTDSILIGNYIELRFNAENISGEFIAPNLDDFQIISGPNTSSSIQIINGNKTSTLGYTYLIKPLELGIYTIEAASINTEELYLATTPIQIEVHPNPDNLIVEPNTNENSFYFDFFSPSFPTTPKPPELNTPTKKKRKFKKL